MNLKKCNDCQQEISINIDSCPKCGSKKPFKDVILSIEETKQLTYQEVKQFSKLGGKLTYSRAKNIFAYLIMGMFLGIILIFFIKALGPKSEEEIRLENEALISKIKTLSVKDIYENYSLYEELIKAFPDNKQYKEKYEFYKNRYDMQIDCEIKATQNNKKLLNNPITYDESLYDGYYQSYWTNTDEYYYQLSFKGKNSFGVEQKFVTKYRCTYNNGKTTFKQIAFNKALD